MIRAHVAPSVAAGRRTRDADVTQTRPTETSTAARLARTYALAIFAFAGAVLIALAAANPEALGAVHPGAFVFFLLFGLFTIEMGYPSRGAGYVSFDRVSQVASVLVLGPLPAALVNGLASLVYPWRRLLNGEAVSRVATASLHNAGLMSLTVLAGGLAYAALGGDVPLAALSGASWLHVGVLILVMQVVNEVGIRVFLGLRDGPARRWPNAYAFAIEGTAAAAGVLVAIVFTRLELPVFALLLFVMALGMFELTQFARMRTRLESMVEERTRALQVKTHELERLATRDQLTGLYNRRYADEHLEQRIEEYDRYRRSFAIALVDLDHFKRVNDEHSHQTGDEVLKRVATILLDRCRETDMVARYGGEEFLLLFPATSARDAWQLCEALRRAIEEAQWPALGNGTRVSLSAGIAEMEAGFSRRTLLGRADRKLYEAKDQGRNRVLA
jgi:diguanylate cyclase (GGDEF)-like protein